MANDRWSFMDYLNAGISLGSMMSPNAANAAKDTTNKKGVVPDTGALFNEIKNNDELAGRFLNKEGINPQFPQFTGDQKGLGIGTAHNLPTLKDRFTNPGAVPGKSFNWDGLRIGGDGGLTGLKIAGDVNDIAGAANKAVNKLTGQANKTVNQLTGQANEVVAKLTPQQEMAKFEEIMGRKPSLIQKTLMERGFKATELEKLITNHANWQRGR